AVHVAAGIVCTVSGIVAMLTPKRAGRHPSAGTVYYWGLVVVFLTMAALSVLRWTENMHLSFAKTSSARQVVDPSALIRREFQSVTRLLLDLLRLLPFLVGGSRQLALETLALRQQFAVYSEWRPGPRLRPTDRLLWVGLARVWTGWRHALGFPRRARSYSFPKSAACIVAPSAKRRSPASAVLCTMKRAAPKRASPVPALPARSR